MPLTRDDETYPLHGHGWLMPWHQVAKGETFVELAAMVDHGQPFRYLALQRYTLAGNTLQMALTVRNEGAPLPFGLGVHPFFPRTSDVRLQARATGMWQAAPDHLPTVLQAPPPHADFPDNWSPAAPSTTASRAGTALPTSFGQVAACRCE